MWNYDFTFIPLPDKNFDLGHVNLCPALPEISGSTYWSRKAGPLSSTNISGDRALIPRQSKKCPQKHGGFLPKISELYIYGRLTPAQKV